MTRINCVIPARLASSRFPKKILASIQGKPMLQWVWERANECEQFDNVVFAIDSDEAAKLIDSFGGKWIMTPVDCPNATRRLITLMQSGKMKGDIWVNWQADEPFVHSGMIDDLLHGSADVWTLKKRIENSDDIDDPSIVKVVSDINDRALYFSRHPIPFQRGSAPMFKHVGLYAYSNEALQKIANFEVTELEECEGLEQLGFLYHGLSIHVFETKFDSMGIDEKGDLERAEAFDTIASYQVQ